MKNKKCVIFLFIIILALQIYPQNIYSNLLKTRTISSQQVYHLLPNKKNPLGQIDKLTNPQMILVKYNSDIFMDSLIFSSPPYRVKTFTQSYLYQNQWLNSNRTSETYDSLGNLVFEVGENWNNNNWSISSRETFAYDSNRNITSDLFEHINNFDSVNDFIITYKYNNNGKLKESLLKNWDSTFWVNSSKLTISYDSKGDKDSMLFESWLGESWTNNLLWTLTNENHIINSYEAKSWDGSQWALTERGNFKDNTNGDWIYGLYQVWNGSLWNDKSRFTYFYNNGSYFTYGLNEICINGQWIPGDGLFQITNPHLLQAFIATEVSIYYKISSVEEKENIAEGYELYQNYPNPFNPSTTIKFTIPYSGFVQLKVYNILGREITTLVNGFRSKGYNEIKFDASKLSSGIYIYQIISGSYVKSKMMMLKK
jgi:hypothetical protein